MRYPDLESMEHPDDLFKGSHAAVLLFLTESESSGHWICCLDHPDKYEVFDSFGTAIDGDRAWLDSKQKMDFHECAPLLSNLLKAGSKKITHNTKKLQGDDMDTCGFWVVARILNPTPSLPSFVSKYIKGPGTPDQIVVAEIAPKLR